MLNNTIVNQALSNSTQVVEGNNKYFYTFITCTGDELVLVLDLYMETYTIFRFFKSTGKNHHIAGGDDLFFGKRAMLALINND